MPKSRVQNPSDKTQFSMTMGDSQTNQISIQCGTKGCTVDTEGVTLDTSIAVADDMVTLASKEEGTPGDMTIQFTDQVCSMDNDALNTAAATLYFDENAELGADAEACMPVIKAMKAGVSSFVDNAGLTDMQNLDQCDYPSCQVLQAGHNAACSNGKPSVRIKNSYYTYDWPCSAAS